MSLSLVILLPLDASNIWKQLIYHRGKWMSGGLSALIEYIKETEFGK